MTDNTPAYSEQKVEEMIADSVAQIELKLAAMTKERDELKQHGEVIISIEQEKSAKLMRFLVRFHPARSGPGLTAEEWDEVLKE